MNFLVLLASQHGFDVVLVDTAGRMQDNEPLMRALAKLVSVNQPDKVVFVGEALVGNEAIDQLTKFNRALQTFGTTKGSSAAARQIDGMILTKFDTVDEKVLFPRSPILPLARSKDLLTHAYGINRLVRRCR